mgnify:FL=1
MLRIEALNIHFGGLQALKDVYLDLKPNEVVGLIGPNGAGKTTLFNALSGIVTPDSGRLTFAGAQIPFPKPHQLAELGIARTLQGVGLFGDLTVLENVMIAAQHETKIGLFKAAFGLEHKDEINLENRAMQSLAMVYASDLAHRRADSLSYPDSKRVALARALVNQPKILMLDEPAGGLGAQDITWMNNLIRTLKSQMSILLVEHHMDVVMSVCDRIYVLNFGEIIASGEADAVRNDPAVIAAYLGTGGSGKK